MYDPLHDKSPGCDEKYPDSYWADVAGTPPEHDGQLDRDIEVDVAIVGAGYTGLSCALHLAREHGIKATVLEANQTAWGASGRNGGFVLKSSGRKPYATMQKQWGEEVMRGIYQEMCEGVDTVKSLIAEGIDCDQQDPGYIRVAHKPSMFKDLISAAKLQQKMFGYDVQILSRQDLHQQYMADQNAHGAIRYQDGFGINPLKLAWGYQRLARQAGVKIHCATPVESWHEQGQNEKTLQVLHTPNGIVKAKKVVIATNGYTPNGFHGLVKNRTLPVLSQIIVTQPLSPQQLEACNFLTSNVIMDTRALKYYYRKLPDNRILFGGRGAITGKGAEAPYFSERLLKVLKTNFPALENINYDYTWSGWLSMALDDLPHIYQNEQQNVFYSMGYCGAGVSFSVQAGKRLAQKVAGLDTPNLPLYQKALPKFPFAPFRRVGQWGFFQYGKVKDTWF
ncbi:FAD-binding oxidoreductase [Colwellia sp. PAMC 21821]|uniref:NAD(P)/FAD-dependent oxidoreductase n=1 Tax=Colwellia sp. PAMC 21821 TaxID=1816219 RepID=UPI0009BD015A|nr:FAD-binding oxidoreductase [Colwellia sp. PAMC 21821]ARD45328.1 oxidoreductase [Colwellia sp. PAMC 21821]